jgi:hypothetical protein
VALVQEKVTLRLFCVVDTILYSPAPPGLLTVEAKVAVKTGKPLVMVPVLPGIPTNPTIMSVGLVVVIDTVERIALLPEEADTGLPRLGSKGEAVLAPLTAKAMKAIAPAGLFVRVIILLEIVEVAIAYQLCICWPLDVTDPLGIHVRPAVSDILSVCPVAGTYPQA